MAAVQVDIYAPYGHPAVTPCLHAVRVQARTIPNAAPRLPHPLPPRRELLQVRHLSPPTLLASAAVLLSTDRDGRIRSGSAARWLSGVSQVRAQVRRHSAHWRRLAAEAEAAG